MSIRPYIAIAVFTALCTPQAAWGQSAVCQFRGAPDALLERPSPLDSVLVVLGGLDAKLCYGRPSAEGRTVVGVEHPFGAPWEMGANEPTTLHLPFAARVGSIELAPGSYSLYAIPDALEWTIVLNGNPDRWGVPLSAEVRAADLGSFPVRSGALDEPVETLTFSFRRAGDNAGELIYAWERVTLSIPVARR